MGTVLAQDHLQVVEVLFSFVKFVYYFMCMNVCLHVCLYNVSRVLMTLEKVFRVPGTGVPDEWELPCGFWESNLGIL